MKRFISLLNIVLVLSLLVAGCAPPSEEQIQKLVQQLGDNNWTTRENATKKLIELGDPKNTRTRENVIKAINKELGTTTDAEVWDRGIRILNKIKAELDLSKSNIEKLVQQLGDDNWATRENATKRLIYLGDPNNTKTSEKVITAVNNELRTTTDPEVRLRVEQILTKIIEELAKQLGDDNSATRENATETLIELGDPKNTKTREKVIKAINKELVKTTDAEVWQRGGQILNRIGAKLDLSEYESDINKLIKQLGDNNQITREKATMKLIQLGNDDKTRKNVIEAIKSELGTTQDLEVQLRIKLIFRNIRVEVPTPTPTLQTGIHPALADGKITIAWIPMSLNNPVFELGRDGAFKKAEELTEQGLYEVEVLYVGSVFWDVAEQIRVMEDMIARRVDAIAVSCNDPDGCVGPINKAVEAGIEVMTWGSDSPDSRSFTYLGVDNYEGGKAAADLLVRFIGEEGKVALLTGVPGAFNLEERIRGFQDGVASYPGIEIAATVYCNDDINLGVQVVEETMQAYPDLDGWFFVGPWPLFAERGSMSLWEEAAQSGQLKTVAFDTLPVGLEYMKDGMLHGLVGPKYWGWGYDTVQMIHDRIVEGKEFDNWTDSGVDIVTEENVDAMIEAWESSDFTQPLPPPF